MLNKLTPDESIIALDVGEARIGIARAGAFARLPEPLKAIPNDEDTISNLKRIIDQKKAKVIVVGIPRNMKGEETAQSKSIREFAKKLDSLSLQVFFTDESLSSSRADTFLSSIKKQDYDQDSVAACFILEEFFTNIGDVS